MRKVSITLNQVGPEANPFRSVTVRVMQVGPRMAVLTWSDHGNYELELTDCGQILRSEHWKKREDRAWNEKTLEAARVRFMDHVSVDPIAEYHRVVK